MHADFWLERWERNQIGFHLDTVNPYLPRHWPRLGLADNTRVLVPLCGKSLDLAWLAAQGLQVMGVELSAKAVAEFFAERHLTPAIRQQGAFSVYQAGSVELWCGDFFALSAADLAGCGGLYDRAALIAMPPAMRQQYAAKLTEIVSPGCQGLLITLDYEQQQIDGPPFAVVDGEVRDLFAGAWQLQVEEERDILSESVKFLKAGATRLEERVYRLARES